MPLLAVLGNVSGVRFDPRKLDWLGSSSNFADDAHILMVRGDAAVKSIEDARRAGGPPLVLGSTAEGTSGNDVPTLLRDTPQHHDIDALVRDAVMTQRAGDPGGGVSSCNQKTRKGRTAMSEIRDVYSRITGKIIADLEQGIRPWHRPWNEVSTMHAFNQRILAEDFVRVRRPDERERYAAAQRQARIDPNPHQIDAVIFALRRLREGGCILADEVGLGKTIEAGLVIAQSRAEGAQRTARYARPQHQARGGVS